MVAEELSTESFDKIVNDSLRMWQVPGVAVAIIHHDQIIYQKSFGDKQIGSNDHVNKETLFSIGSLTKAMTATAFALLVEEKKMTWDDPVAKHLPSFYLFNPYVTQSVTIRDLLSHRTGLGAHEGDLLWIGQPFSRKEIFHRSRYLTPTFGFRETYAYQNVLYVIAGEIIESISGLNWDEFVKQKLFIPLGMKHTFSFLKTQREQKNISSPHAEIDHSIQTIAWDSVESFGPAGSAVSNISDMTNWLSFQLKLSRGVNTPLISAENNKELYFPHIAVPLDPILKNLYPDSNFVAYGLGWFLSDYHGRKVIQHDGLINGMSSFLLMIPQENFGIIVLSNRKDSLLPHAISYKVMDKVLKCSEHQWDKEFFETIQQLNKEEIEAEKTLSSQRVVNTSPSHPFSDYTGRYFDQLYGEVIISSNDNITLQAKVIATSGTLEHWHYDTFRFIPDDKTLSKPLISFYFDSEGKMESLTIPTLLPTIEFIKMDEQKFALSLSTEEENAWIDSKIDSFNKDQFSFTGQLEIPINYIIKDKNVIIAGIRSCFYLEEVLSIGVLFVEDTYRNKGLGTLLLNKVEAEASGRGAKLAHLYAFDQTKDFYLSHGYEIFGILENCPKTGHSCFYLKKEL